MKFHFIDGYNGLFMISIVIPVYNAEEYLERCLYSLQKQSFSSFEAIIVNDGSTDKSAFIADLFCKQDSRFILISQENAGVSVARNTGINNSTGDAICFVDADDYVDELYLEKLFASFEFGSLSICNFVRDEECEKILSANWKKKVIDFNQNFIKDYLVYSMGKTIAFSPWNKLFDNHLLHKANIRFPESIKIGEDMIFVLSYLSMCKSMHFIDEGLYHYCERQGSAMNCKKNYLLDYEMTLQGLKRCGNFTIEVNILNLWARERLILLLANPFVNEMKYEQFKAYYYDYLKKSEIFNRVKKSPFVKDFKRNALTLTAKLNSSILLYLIVICYKKLSMQNN